MDELGRGTSTFDGYSIAHAVMKHLVKTTKSLTLFSTHYHMLLEDFKDDFRVKLYHMGFRQESKKQHKITFLYKFVEGACPSSFGLNVARMAGLPTKVLDSAFLKSQHFA